MQNKKKRGLGTISVLLATYPQLQAFQYLCHLQMIEAMSLIATHCPHDSFLYCISDAFTHFLSYLLLGQKTTFQNFLYIFLVIINDNDINTCMSLTVSPNYNYYECYYNIISYQVLQLMCCCQATTQRPQPIEQKCSYGQQIHHTAHNRLSEMTIKGNQISTKSNQSESTKGEELNNNVIIILCMTLL